MKTIGERKISGIGMADIPISDKFSEKIEIGKNLFESRSQSYPEDRVADMKRQISELITPQLKEDIGEKDLFYHSVYDFWVYGNTTSEEIYFHFPYKSHDEKMQYTTFRTRQIWMSKINDRAFAHLFNNKYETYEFLQKWFCREIVRISDQGDFKLFSDFVTRHPVFVVKPTSSHIGIGVKKVNIEECGDVDALFSRLLQEGLALAKDSFYQDSSFLLEEVIEQDEKLASIHPYSVNGIRITTLRQGNDVKILYPWFKVGANKAFVTSAAFGTYDAGIDAVTGVVNTDGYKENGEKDAVHPLTKITFKGFQIPKWDELLKCVVDLAQSLPAGIDYIGWDMVLTPRGWCVMEGNFTGDFMWQMFMERGFRAEWEELTGIRLDKKFWWQ